MQTTKFALFRGNTQISKAHAIKHVTIIEAYEKGAVVKWSADFFGDKPGESLANSYSIKEIKNVEQDR